MIQTVLIIALGIMALGIAACTFRLLKGPSGPDRIIALDTIGILLLAMVAMISLFFRTQSYTEIILLIGILSFIGTTALARYIERGVVLEHGNTPDDR